MDGIIRSDPWFLSMGDFAHPPHDTQQCSEAFFVFFHGLGGCYGI